MTDLGRVYYQFLKHNLNGSLFFVVVKNFSGKNASILGQGLKFCEIEKLENLCSSNFLNNSTNMNNSMTQATHPTNSSNSFSSNCGLDDGFLIKHIKVKL